MDAEVELTWMYLLRFSQAGAPSVFNSLM